MAFVSAISLRRASLEPRLSCLKSTTIRRYTVPRRPQVRATMTKSAPTLPPRVIPTPLPSVLVYDHCPFCVRVRLVLGLKNVKHRVVWLMNDDIDTPTALVGRKIVPIFQAKGLDGPAQMESLDICATIDTDPRYGPTGMIREATDRKDIWAWLDELSDPMRRLTRVRFAVAPLPEFVFADAREAFVRNHPLKEEPTDYEEVMQKSEEYIAKVQGRLDELADMIHSPYHCSPEGLSYDDVQLFPRLHALTIVKGLVLPKAIRDYVEYLSSAAEVPLYDYCAM